MQQLEPTYLRYVYDGLSKGSISSNNPTSLPIGFIGLFEDEFPSSMPLVERTTRLNSLAVWALLKGPVSIEMVAEVLNEYPDNTKALIDRYSKWFNSPEPGKYVLYHDRLRIYLLQKLSDHELEDLNQTLISYLENALSSEGLKEAESYALEHLSTHLAIESQMGNNYERLHDFVNQEGIWKKQISTSNEYKWSQRALQYSIKEGARRHHEMNTLASTVNSVKLMQDEENSINQIFDILNEGDYQTAIERVLFFNGQKLITICLLMINELLINEKQSDDYKSKVYNEVLEIFKKNDIETDNFPAILIYNFYLEFKRLNLDYSVILKKSSFNCNDILYLLEFSEIDINEIEYLVKNFIHLSDYPDIYIAISKFYLEKNDKNKIDFYLKKALVAIQNIPLSYGKYYSLVEEDNDLEYYRIKLKWKILIGFIYFKIEDFKSAKEVVDDIFLYTKEINNNDNQISEDHRAIGDNKTIYPQSWFEIYHLCFLLGSYEYVINSKKFNEFVNVKNTNSAVPEKILSLSRILLIQENYVLYENFINHIKNKNFSKIIILEIDYFITLCKLEELEKAYLKEQEIIKKINSLEFGKIKFDILLYFAETLFLTEKKIKNKHEGFKKSIKKSAKNIVDHFYYNLNRLKDKNTHFYFNTISNLITLFFNVNKITEALEIYDIYFNEIIKNNIQNPKDKHSYFRLLFDSILTFNYKTPESIIKKSEEIINDKHYYSDEEKLEFFMDIKNKTFKNLLIKGYHEEAHIFAKKHNIKLHLFNYHSWSQNGINLKINTIKKADLFEKNENLQSFSILTNSQISDSSFSLELLESLDQNKLIKIVDYIRKDDYIKYSLEINNLINNGYNKQIQRFLLGRLNNKLKTFKYKKEYSNFYKSITGKIVKKTFLKLPRIIIKNDLIDFNFIILNELSYKMNWKDLEILIDQFKFDFNLQIIYGDGISNISSANKLVLEESFLNVKLKLLLKKLFVDNDPNLINKLFEICSKLSENFIKDSKVSTFKGGRQNKVNYSAYAYLQFSNVLNQIGLQELAIKAITKANESRSIDAKFVSPTNTNIIKVFIHICMSSLEKSEILTQFDKIIDFYNIYIENIEEDSPEQLLYLLIEPLVQLGETSKGIQVANMIVKIIKNIPIKHNKMLYIDDNGWELPNTELARKQKSISNISYFYYAIGDYKKGDEYYNMLSDELIYDSDTFCGDDDRKVGFDKKEILNKYKNKIFPKYEKKTTENIVLKENEIEFNGLVYHNFKDRKIMESNFDFSFTKNNIEFEFLSKNQNPKDVFSYLFYKAKMACFFEVGKNDEKLKLLSQVIDINDWRNISANL